MRQAASCAVELDCDGDACRHAGSQAKEQSQAETVADAEDNRVRYRASEHPQRPVLSTQ